MTGFSDGISNFIAAGTTHDTLDFSGNSVSNSQRHGAHPANGRGALISDSKDSLRLDNVNKSALTASDFGFSALMPG
jgi:hypothetical protein